MNVGIAADTARDDGSVTAVIDRRRHPRRPGAETDWRHMRLRTGDELSIVDIGPGGALVDSPRRLLPGVTIRIHLAAADRALTIDARVVRCCVHALEPGGGVRYRGALEFGRERWLRQSPLR